MKSIPTAAKVFLKILEVGHWVATGLMALAAIFSAFAPSLLKYVISIDAAGNGTLLSAYGFEINVSDGAGSVNNSILCLFAIGSLMIFTVIAFIFRNLYKIIKDSEKSTPFSEANVKRLKRISNLALLVPVIGFIMTLIINLIFGDSAADIAMDQSGAVLAIIIMCLAQYFAYGAELEKDVDGLV
ncbi:MAG: DUF2975 domain-containing protein [Ruminococcaceae bacterium]|nr:DUF2975 domain-containing protein [Oscillospiraceae bacterium]